MVFFFLFQFFLATPELIARARDRSQLPICLSIGEVINHLVVLQVKMVYLVVNYPRIVFVGYFTPMMNRRSRMNPFITGVNVHPQTRFVGWLWLRKKNTLLRVIPTMAFNSSHLTFSLANLLANLLAFYSVWHSIWHIFWHSIWHSIWHIYLACLLTFYLIWHIFWHSIWHPIWHVFWHSI